MGFLNRFKSYLIKRDINKNGMGIYIDLLSYVDEYFNSDFEYCLYAVRALRNYVSNDSIAMIRKAIYSNNFRIRDVACESLAVVRLGLDVKELNDFEFEDDVTDMYNYHVKKNMKKTVK